MKRVAVIVCLVAVWSVVDYPLGMWMFVAGAAVYSVGSSPA